jgi:hypothetical protein
MKNIFIFNFSKNCQFTSPNQEHFFPISNFMLPDDFWKQVSFCATSEQNSTDQHNVAANNTLSSLLTTHQ